MRVRWLCNQIEKVHLLLLMLLFLMYISLWSVLLELTSDRFNDCDAGKGAVYSFDPVGSYQRDTYKAGGSASAMLQPLLDNQVNKTWWFKAYSAKQL